MRNLMGSAGEGGGPSDARRTLKTLLPFIWPKDAPGLRARVVIACICLVAAKIATVYVPILFKKLVDALTAGPADLAIVVPLGLLLAYGLARVISQGFNELRDGIFAKVVQRAVRQVATITFRHLHALSLRFHLERQTGGLSRIVDRGVKGIEFLLLFVVFNVLPTIIEILLVCGLLWSFYDFWFALVTFSTVAIYVVHTYIVTRWRLKIRRIMNDADGDANTKALDSLLNYETVKYFGNEEHEARRYDGAFAVYERAAVKNRTSLAALNIGQAFIIAVGVTTMMTMAAAGIRNGTMTVGDFVLVNAYLIQLYMPLNLLGMVYREIRQSLIDMEAMFKLLDVPPEVQDQPGAPALAVGPGEIRFEHVDFGYDPRRPILKDVSFVVPPGHKVAIVGPSGAGKSTISRLLFRFYDVTGGRVLIDAQDVRTVTQASLRDAIGIVPQDTVLFNDTVRYNIAYGKPGSPPDRIERAAQLAHIHDFIRSLPDGYETRVGERGLKLSGGEKQRVAIARTILKDPAILLFDEATSALDTRTEKDIQHNLAEVSQGRSTLMIAHRLSTVVDADEILVLEEGRIVERGRHADLLQRRGRYAEMWARQQANESEHPLHDPITDDDPVEPADRPSAA
ncbi:MAG: ABC transporter ATP-binding protein/permease [Rhodospirillaceae bacterium]|nr:ABC transporter ATP-binding protein/permease [Rhodospirillaceae bacterium]